MKEKSELDKAIEGLESAWRPVREAIDEIRIAFYTLISKLM